MANLLNLEDKRLELHSKLLTILGNDNVYFQPPESIRINYPAIIYERYDIPTKDADNEVYLRNCKYRVTLIDKDPTNDVVDKLSLIVNAKFNRHFVSEGLNHDVFTVYY